MKNQPRVCPAQPLLSERSPQHHGSTPTPRFTVRNPIGYALALLLVIVTTGEDAESQTITGLQNISFGTLTRAQQVTVRPSNPAAAQFRITGILFLKLRMAVSVTNLNRSGRTMALTVRNSDCEYSLNGGSTWLPFTTGTLYHDLTLISLLPSIYVRVGGTIAAGTIQQRGSYGGAITLTVTKLGL